MTQKITFKPVGVIHTPFKPGDNVPIQPSRGRDIEGRIAIYPEFVPALKDLEMFSHVYLITYLHHSKSFKLQTIPYHDTAVRGLFSTRSPHRPNPIGLSIVRVKSVEDNIIYIQDIDLMDGTPLLDIKPYIRRFDDHEDVRCGWLDRIEIRSEIAD